jgi:glycosyltransferase involved in cell wall biosynthesis
VSQSVPAVTVLTPVYNGEQFLAECIKSVLDQTYSDWEYLVLDNQSSDRTPDIVQEFAAKDSRVKHMRPHEFVDMYANHNRAIAAMPAGTRYCKFVHADDLLYPECLERMVRLADANPSVGLVGAFRLSGTRVELDAPFPVGQSTMPGRQAIRRELLHMGWVTGSPSNVLFRAELLRKMPVPFDSRIWHADTETCYRVLLDSDLGFEHQILSYTRLHPGAATPFSNTVYSYLSRDGLMLLRYGPLVLSRDEYKRALWGWTRRYGRWLVRQLVLDRGRRQNPKFHEFHRGEIDLMVAEAGNEPMVRAVLSGYRRLLRS